MTRRRNEPKPWDRPGFKFYTDAMRKFMGGYEPVIAGELMAKRSTADISRQSSESRMKQAATGTGWGTGTLEGLGVDKRRDKPNNNSRAHMAQVHQGGKRTKR